MNEQIRDLDRRHSRSRLLARMCFQLGFPNELLGCDSWINLFIPKSQALVLSGAALDTENTLNQLEDQLIQVHAALSKPDLPLYRVTWDAFGNRRQEEGKESLTKRLEELKTRS